MSLAGPRRPETALLRGVADKWFNPKDLNENWPQRKLRAHLWSGQQRIRDSVRCNRYTAVPSGHDLGKSFIASAIGCEWIDVHEIGEAFLVSTAPTSAQVTAILWREIERMHRKAGLEGRITRGRIPEWVIGKQLVGYGRKPSDYDDQGFQGIHDPFVLIIVDEAPGIPELLWNAITALATNENARVLALGNPNDGQSYFRTICMPGSGWNVVHLDGLYSPNFSEYEVKAVSNKPGCGDLYQYMVDKGIPFSTEEIPFEVQQSLLSPLWVAEQMQRWGVYRLDDGSWTTHPLWEGKVRGKFADASTDGVIPLAWVEAAIDRWREWRESGLPVEKLVGQRVYGVDVAGEGSDETCVAERIGYTVLSVDRNGWGTDTMTPVNRLSERAVYKPGTFVVDANGIGTGVKDRLRELGFEVTAFIAQERTDMFDHSGEYSFDSVRSAAWWNLRELLDPSNPATMLMLPDDEFLIADLTAPKWRIAPGAKIVVESKKETRKRLRRSPDTGDAVIMSLWMSGLASGEATFTQYGGESEYVVAYYGTSDNAFVAGRSEFEDVLSSYVHDNWS